ncbi:uncharacterized protein si:ch211-131k2.2 [Trichomycterus rosablanca]|uniref:uncharacterized protein si:ch211-131k2.2 n=1 Tax=Trichomycterus rosablanca TaxID=2290929 RepID=UPI002F35FFD4
MENMKLVAVVTALTALACMVNGMSFTLDKEQWTSKNWEDEPLMGRLASEVEGFIKRSKAHHFYGLMGKRSGTEGGRFAGLVGRRSLTGGTLTRITPDETSLESEKQSGSQEGLDELQYY